MVEIFQNLMKIINTLGFPFPKGKSVGLIFWIFIGKTEAEVEAPILWPPDAKSWLIGKDPMLGKIEGKRRRGWQMMRWLDSITDSRDMNLSKLGDTVKDREARCAAVHGGTKSWTWLSDWTTTTLFTTHYLDTCNSVKLLFGQKYDHLSYSSFLN